MSYSFPLSIFELPPSPNKKSAHHSGVRASWRQKVHKAINARGLPDFPLTRARITCIRYSQRPLDFDNLVYSFKSVIDGLQDCGVIENDSMKVLVQRDYQWKRSSQDMITVLVEALP